MTLPIRSWTALPSLVLAFLVIPGGCGVQQLPEGPRGEEKCAATPAARAHGSPMTIHVSADRFQKSTSINPQIPAGAEWDLMI